MKYKFLLFALCCSLFVACKKNSDPAPDENKRITEQVLGSWIRISQTVTYYDKSGNIAKSETEQQGNTGQIFEFSNNNLLKVKQSGAEESLQYTITPVNGKQQLNVKRNSSNSISSELYYINIVSDVLSLSLEQDITNDPNYSKGTVAYNFKRM